MDGRPPTLAHLLQWRARTQPERAAYTFLTDGETEEATLTYGALHRKAQLIAQWLRARGAAGERVLLLYPSDLEYVAAFFGCLYAGAVAVPAYPPRLNRTLHRLQAVAADSQAAFALSVSAIRGRVEPLCAQFPNLRALRWLTTDDLDGDADDGWHGPELSGDTVAFLQYTSGSTGQPKGVMVSHGNLLHNEQLIQHAFGQTEQSVIVGWLPLYHDMGLIGNVLQTLYVGARCVLMSPVAFLQSPFRWLDAVSRFRATTSGGPNFAYDLCVRKVSEEQRARLDLSSWKVAFNGAEPIRPETLERFAGAFGPCGFNPEAFHPCYGLAEATLFVSGKARPGRPRVELFDAGELAKHRAAAPAGEHAEGKLLASCGVSPGGQQLVVVNPETMSECLPGEVGEVWVSSPSVAGGYWNQPELSAQTFRARLGLDGETFLRTGDLGFLHGGELFVTGRLKDLIIIRGLNHYPQDIERTAEQSHPALRAGCGAAFSLEVEGEERLVIVQEVERRPAAATGEIIDAIRQRVAEEHEVQVYAVALVRQGSIAKTSSGKIQRKACRASFLKGELSVEAEWREAAEAAAPETSQAPRDESLTGPESPEGWLRASLAALLRVEPARIDLDQPITRYGLDSLMAVELSHGIEARFGVALPLSSLLEGLSISELAARLTQAAPPENESAPEDASAAGAAAGGGQPLSSSQQSLWFLHRLAPEDPTYNLAFAARIRAGLDVGRLRLAFQALVDRHASLRTTFVEGDGEPWQRVHEHVPVCFEEHDAAGLEEARLRELMAAEAQRPFDLERGPLLKVHLFARAGGEYVLLLAAHHIIVDFWSLTVLMHELGVLYGAQRRGVRAELPPLPRQQLDYVLWQRAMLRSEAGAGHWAYWQRQLSGRLPVLELPTDRPRPPVQTYRGAAHTFRLGAELTRRLKDLSQSREATLYMTLLAAFQVWLHRYTGQEEILVGSPTSGRSRGWLAGLVSYLVNPVVLRAELSGRQTFAEFLGQVRRNVLAAFEHQDYPFALLVKSLQPERDASRSPLFQAMFALQKSHLRDGQGVAAFAVGDERARIFLDDLVLEAVTLPQRASHFDLSLVMVEVGEQLVASLEYNTDLFDAATVERMSRQFEVLLEGVAADAGARLSELPILPEDERRRILFEWNETRRDFPTKGQCVHRQFERQAAARPAAPALRRGPDLLTYGALNAGANRLARRLRAAGVGPEAVVGLCAGRGFELAAGALAVLKAGGAYLPLDPSYPAERLRYMLDDSRAAVLLTTPALSHKFSGTSATVISLDAEDDPGASRDGEDVDGGATPENLAYVIYTSGSTGRPKGVAVAHAALANLAAWHAEAFRVTAADRATLIASVSFDASVWELWPYLCAGAALDVADDETRSSPERLRDWLVARGVTISFVPTPVAEPLLGLGWGGGAALRALLTGGDRLRGRPRAGLPFAVVNNYGPTENAVVATSGLVAPAGGADEAGARAPSLGRPLPNVRAYILDGRGGPAPVGVAGELYVGGRSLARGYLGRAGLTAERFVPDPYGGERGGRLYRTGDLARYLPDGEIEFLGRIGNQVKVRGHRIELGEVEVALREVDGVREAVVECREERACERTLTAYVVLDENAGAPTGKDLRSALREKLPEYMVPSYFVELDAMPLTRNGKIDRLALPAPAPDEEDEEASAARTPTEELLSNIWTEVLGRRRIGLRDNFFDLGGHSLLATQVASRVRETFNVELPLRTLFESPTVAELAVSVEKAVQAEAGGPSAPIERVSRDGDLPLSFAQQRLWFLDQLAPGNTAYNIQVSVRLLGEFDRPALESAVNEIVRRHEALRTTFAVRAGRPTQLVAPELTVPLPVSDVADRPAEERAAALRRVFAEEVRRPFDLGRLPLLRFRLLKLGEAEHALLLTMHHIISDGWSMGVFTRELAALYEAYAAGRPSPLAELSVQYADFAHWQREWLRGEVLEQQLAYWKRQLGHRLPVLELPTDRPRPPVQSFRGERRLFTLDAGLARALKAFSSREGVTLYMVTLAAFKALLSRYTSQDDIVVGTDIANRNRAETEQLIGFFVNQLVLRTNLSGNPTFRELLRRVREVTLGAYAHQDLPFERLVEELAPERDLSRNPLFQVMFIFQNSPMPALEIGGLTIEQLELSEGTTAFDISLALTQTARGELGGFVRYSSDLFDAETIERLIGHYETVLRSAVADAETRLGALEIFTEAEKRQKAVEKEERQESKLKKLMSVRPKAVKLSEQALVRETRLSPEASLPLVLEPGVDGVDLVAWAGQHRARVESRLQRHGALLFRGFGAQSLARFEQFAEALAPGLMAYGERSSPRHVLSGNVYTSTDHPADQYILLHNEQSYTLNWPMKIWFFCVRPAEQGGRTPIADSRRIYQRLPPPLVEKFAQRQVMYVRNYGDMLGLSWQEGFQTEDKRAVEEHCRRASIEFEWKDGDRLRTKQVRPAVRTHPRTGETIWFNHAFFFNVASLEATARESLRSGLDDMDLPFNTFYGDGSPIEPSVIEQIRDTYRREQVAFDWQPGDILMLDNMLAAHGREPFSGPRQIAVAMGEPYAQLKNA